MRSVGLVVAAALLPGVCNAAVVEMSADAAFQKAAMVLVDLGAIPTFRDRELMVIKTDATPVKLTPEQADCGKMFGIPYLKDKRTHTAATYQVVVRPVSETSADVTVKVSLDGYMAETEGAPFFVEKTRDRDKVLTCTSKGWLESQFFEKLQSAS